MVAAETGSGKTHGYLVPLMDKLCRTVDNSENAVADEELSQPHSLSLVLCPNVMLYEQVVQMANCLCNDSSELLLRIATICVPLVLTFLLFLSIFLGITTGQMSCASKTIACMRLETCGLFSCSKNP